MNIGDMLAELNALAVQRRHDNPLSGLPARALNSFNKPL
jgi:hypothetical protein